MTEPSSDYRVLQQQHVNKWDERLGRAVAGWEYKVLDLVTDTTVPVFVPETVRTPEVVRQVIERALEPVRQIAQLGQ